jgi:UDP:flavonoid glycosyltransferase YjiC (YdhE family)
VDAQVLGRAETADPLNIGDLFPRLKYADIEAHSVSRTDSTMRILFSCTPALGHVVPVIPLARAARDAGHDVGFLTSAGMRGSIDADLPLLGVGPMPQVVLAEAEKRGAAITPTGASAPKNCSGFFVLFVRMAVDEALEQAGQWKPDLIVAERSDLVGPFVAAELGIPWSTVAIGPAMEAELVEGVAAALEPLYEERGVARTAPVATLDVCPPTLQAPGWSAPENHVTLRPEPHSQAGHHWSAAQFPGREHKPLVLVTLGTVFNSASTLTSVLDSLTALDVNLLVTAAPGFDREAVMLERSRIHVVDFVPLDRLLEGVGAVVTVGGAGTTLATLSRGIPLVIFPQGADHFRNAARAGQAGAAVTVDDEDKIAEALSRVLTEDAFRSAAQAVAEEISRMNPPAKALEQALALVPGA